MILDNVDTSSQLHKKNPSLKEAWNSLIVTIKEAYPNTYTSIEYPEIKMLKNEKVKEKWKEYNVLLTLFYPNANILYTYIVSDWTDKYDLLYSYFKSTKLYSPGDKIFYGIIKELQSVDIISDDPQDDV